MLIIPPPMTNAERQRRFCRANPGYYARIQARKRAAANADTARYIAALATAAAVDSSVDVQTVQLTAEAPTSC
jgi:hypothetical protein